jgi:hypothetical protein
MTLPAHDVDGTTGTAGTDLAWERALDELEAQTLEAEARLRALRPDEVTPWELPHLAGTLPAHLAPRARDLHRRQQEMLDRIPAILGRMRQQRSVTDRITWATGPVRRPVYIDQSA